MCREKVADKRRQKETALKTLEEEERMEEKFTTLEPHFAGGKVL